MSGLLEYSGVATKIRAMQSKLLTREDFEIMAEKNSISEVLTYLAGTEAYGKILSPENNPDIPSDILTSALTGTSSDGKTTTDISIIERILYRALYVDYDKLYRFSGKGPKNYLSFYLIKHEVELIKTCLERLFNKTRNTADATESTNILIYKDFFDKRSKIDLTKLYESESIGELIDCLAKTVYYPTLKLLKDNENAALFDYESQLDIFLFKTMWDICTEQMPASYRKVLKDIYGEQIDLLNLQWVYRGRKYYRLTEAQMFKLLIPVYYRVKRREILALIRAESDEEFTGILGSLYYMKLTPKRGAGSISNRITGHITAQAGDSDHIDNEFMDKVERYDLEKIYDDRMEQLYKSSQKNNPYSVACVANHMYIKEKEIEDLIKLIEFVGYNRGKDFISYKYKEGVIG